MKKIFALFMIACATLFAPSVVSANAVTPSRVETPCKEAGHTREQACIVVDQFVSGNNPTVDSRLDVAPAKALQGKAQTFSVIYVYHLHPGAVNHSVGMTVTRGGESLMYDTKIGQPVSFWVTTRDGGKTWSKLTTTDMNGALAF